MYINKTAMIELDDVIIWSASTYRDYKVLIVAPISDRSRYQLLSYVMIRMYLRKYLVPMDIKVGGLTVEV